MSDSPPGVRQRASKKKGAAQAVLNPGSGPNSEDELLSKKQKVSAPAPGAFGHAQGPFRIWLFLLTIAAIFTRFYKISHPKEVVFDEVHFGKVWCWSDYELIE